MKFYMHLGNSTIKYGIANENGYEELHYVDINNVIEEEILRYVVLNKSKIKQIIYSSINNKFFQMLESISKITNLKWKEILTRDFNQLKIDAKNKNEWGIDIDLCFNNVVDDYDNAILIDFGFLTKVFKMSNKKIEGGVIMPCCHLQIRSLLYNTYQINTFKEEEVENDFIGRNQNQALTAGVFYGQMLIIKEMIKKFKFNKNKDKIIITGGHFNKEIFEIIVKVDYEYDYFYLMKALLKF